MQKTLFLILQRHSQPIQPEFLPQPIEYALSEADLRYRDDRMGVTIRGDWRPARMDQSQDQDRSLVISAGCAKTLVLRQNRIFRFDAT